MAWYDFFTRIGGRSWLPHAGRQSGTHQEQEASTVDTNSAPATEKINLQEDGTGSAPVRGGRSSVMNTLSFAPDIFNPEPLPFSHDNLKVLHNAFLYNVHIGRAVNNVVSLANTNHEIYFADTVRKRQQQKMMDHLKRKRDRWYEFSDGHRALQTDLLVQLAVFGVLSSEMEIQPDLQGVKRVHRVTPLEVEFAWDKALDMWVPLQRTNLPSEMLNRNNTYAGYIRLNTATYMYMALNRYDQLPYGIPPMMSALEKIAVENDMLESFRIMMKHIGLLGFLSVLTQAPQRKAGEDDDAYFSRLNKHLDELLPQIEKGFAKGIVVGYQRHHEFNIEGNKMNVEGAEGLVRMIKQYVYAGVNQDANLHGENYSVTETFGRVILAIMTEQMDSYQDKLAAFWEKVYFTELILAGFKPGFVQVEYERAIITDQKREAETEKLKINNVISKRNEGFIGQDQAAQELGYEKAYAEEPQYGNNKPQPEPELEDDDNTRPDNTSTTDAQNSKALKKLLRSLGADLPELELFVNTENHPLHSYDKELESYINDYYDPVEEIYFDAVENSRSRIRAGLANLNESTNVDTVEEVMLYHLLRNWEKDFKKPVNDIVDQQLSRVYQEYRKDEQIFDDGVSLQKQRKYRFALNGNSHRDTTLQMAAAAAVDIPEAKMDLLDLRAINYLSSVDQIYLGKFITDADTRDRMKTFIEVHHLGENSPIGRDASALNKFVNDFIEVVKLEKWKIRRIIDTTVNKTRNFAHVNYLNQAEIASFEIVAVMDSKTSPTCQALNGRRFDVTRAVKKIEKVIKAGADDIERYSPFASNYAVDELNKMSDLELQKAGIDTPPFHPHCRTRIVAVF